MSRTAVMTVSVQLLCIALLIITGPMIPRQTGALIAACAGVAVIAWAVLTMGLDNLHVEPDVYRHARLVTKGPYRLIRHPMYTGGTLIVAGWLWDHFTVVRLVIGIILIGDFVVKLVYEEKLLQAKFAEYADYMKRSKRLVPWVY